MSVLAEHTVMPPGPDAAQPTATAILADDTELSLVTADGRSVPLSAELRTILIHADHALSEGQAVTVEPRPTVLSTQEAADMLGVSRPTLVKLLEAGTIPYTQPRRHRRLLLADILEYQHRERDRRRAVLDEMSSDAAADDSYGQIADFPQPN